MSKKTTKRALAMSFVSVFLCVCMLVGTTFAWFTDEVASSGSTIQAGTLQIDLVDATGNSLEGEMIEWDAFDNRAQNEIFWEPGCTYNTEDFYIVNKGNLNLKFKFDVTGIDGDAKLLEVIDFTCKADASWFKFNTGAVSVSTSGEFDLLKGCEVDTLIYGTQTFTEYVLEPGAKVGPIVLTGRMDQTAGNEYQGLSINGIAVSIVATQATGEEDSVNATYDENATYPDSAFLVGDETLTAPPAANAGDMVTVANTDNTFKVTAKAADTTTPVTATIEPTTTTSSVLDIATNAGKSVVSYDIDVEGQEANSEVTVDVFVGTGLVGVDVYHNGVKMTSGVSYNATTGFVTITATSFSPYEITFYRAEDVPVANYYVSTADELVEALENTKEGEIVCLMSNITIDPAKMSNAYGKTGIVVQNGQILDGNGKTLTVKGAGATWDSGVCLVNGTMKNLTVAEAFRGIFIRSNTQKVFLENVTTMGTTYTISLDSGNYGGLEATNCTFNGWTSYAETMGEVTFTNCTFSEGSGYKFCRPYAPTTFTDCKFEAEGYRMDPRAAVTFEDCTLNGVAITADNVGDLVYMNSDKATVK